MNRWTITSVIVVAVASVTCGITSSSSHPRRIEFRDVGAANRIDVVGLGNQVVTTITDPAKIRAADRFIVQHRDGWIDVFTGPRAPSLMLEFYSDDRPLGSFGLAPSYIVAGSLSKDVPSADISTFARALGLEWPVP